MNYISTEVIEEQKIKITNYLNNIGIDTIRKEIIRGLTSKQKYISSKFFYDEKGSKLFEEITRLPEYYPTRTEKHILKGIAPELMGRFYETDIVELGSGDCSKINILLDSAPKDNLTSINYVPMDVSSSAILKSAENLTKLFPELTINGLVADFIDQLNIIPDNRKRMFCLLGSTIGNFDENIVNRFLNNLRSSMNKGDTFLLGIDLVKPEPILHDAYNDKQGVTAKFNKNILNVINNLIDSNFNINDFEHKAFYDKYKSRIEMHLVANKNIIINSPYHNSDITILKGENVHTENSYKYYFERFNELEEVSGLKINKVFTDSNKWFALILFEK